jgi:hypothetical protein
MRRFVSPKLYSQVHNLPESTVRANDTLELKLVLPIPFKFEQIVANNNIKDLHVKNILIGDRSLIVSGGTLPIEVFWPDSWTMSFHEPYIPVNVPLLIIVLNTSSIEKRLSVSVFGIGPKPIGLQLCLSGWRSPQIR